MAGLVSGTSITNPGDTHILNNLGACYSQQLEFEAGHLADFTVPLYVNHQVMNGLHQVPILHKVLLFVEAFECRHPLFISRDLLVHFGLQPKPPAFPRNFIQLMFVAKNSRGTQQLPSKGND